MKKTLFVAAALVAGLTGRADALTLTLEDVTGSWDNAEGAPATTNYATVGDEARVLWGTDGGFGQSGLGFTGNQALPIDLLPSQEFTIGTLRHFNNPVVAPTVNSVDLTLALSFHDVMGASTFRFNFQITETPNTPPCPFPSTTPCSDKISFPSAFTTQTFTYAGRVMTLEIVGFRTTPGGPIVTEFISDERQTNSAVLVGRLHVISGGCTLTQGYWKNHAKVWPVTSLSLGNVAYTQAQLLAIFATPVRGNGLVSLAHQLIAAKLNRYNFAATPDVVDAAIGQADAVIGDLVVPRVGTGSLTTTATASLVSLLDDYNNGGFGVAPHCK